MAQFDLPLDELREYRSASAEPEGFDTFWAKTLQEAREHDLDARFEPVQTPLKTVKVYDVTFAGFGGHPIKGWLTLPAWANSPLPTVVEFVGYGGGRGLSHTHLLWASAGFAHFVMDTRGQGSGWGGGETPDPVGSAPSYPGYMTRGIDAPENYYYRRVFTDGVRAVEAARSHPLVDAERVAAVGGSQGGGITIAVGGLVPDLAAIAPDVPFLCDFPRATTLTDRHPYREIGNYLKTYRGRTEDVLRTLSYFDGVHFAARGRAPALFSVALEDQTCPPSTIFAAFNAWDHEDKKIEVYDFNDHEGGGTYQEAAKLDWLPAYL
ncbi:acetylxylan esterase [Streptomyces sp. NBC_01340]|uniref:acetylxylan esterase n=1 Tax=unclassified Streptomyces TaxID=2593676 RepID=UPI0022589514|nr:MULTISPECIES: acetylxylan esterase [unclassified Streptomyces]MCX4459170.1 acetylxylan esterase [Streptomyces sp. NBC_01719]MCX4498527.1 acetylxylan esterase [Streptomyces sp. NBC_01728]MCX4595559.1 acetylxylan esterase [Streptomyces sp. NBC_01549]WSI43019.1 acetylxylan esterase [Streptomyces sp. NBC_01340]